MKSLVIAVALALSASSAHAEATYNADFVEELRSLGRAQEAFQYALTWAGSGDPDAEIEVVYSLLEGRGVDSDPIAAMAFACGPRTMDQFYVQKALVAGNLRLAGSGVEIVRCASFVSEK